MKNRKSRADQAFDKAIVQEIRRHAESFKRFPHRQLAFNLHSGTIEEILTGIGPRREKKMAIDAWLNVYVGDSNHMTNGHQIGFVNEDDAFAYKMRWL